MVDRGVSQHGKLWDKVKYGDPREALWQGIHFLRDELQAPGATLAGALADAINDLVDKYRGSGIDQYLLARMLNDALCEGGRNSLWSYLHDNDFDAGSVHDKNLINQKMVGNRFT